MHDFPELMQDSYISLIDTNDLETIDGALLRPVIQSQHGEQVGCCHATMATFDLIKNHTSIFRKWLTVKRITQAFENR